MEIPSRRYRSCNFLRIGTVPQRDRKHDVFDFQGFTGDVHSQGRSIPRHLTTSPYDWKATSGPPRAPAEYPKEVAVSLRSGGRPADAVPDERRCDGKSTRGQRKIGGVRMRHSGIRLGGQRQVYRARFLHESLFTNPRILCRLYPEGMTNDQQEQDEDNDGKSLP